MLFFGSRERLERGRGVAVFQPFTKPDPIPETFVRRSNRCGKRIGRNSRSACAARRGAIFSAEISRISRKMLFLRHDKSYVMTEKLIRKVWIAVSAAILWGCGGMPPPIPTVDGDDARH